MLALGGCNRLGLANSDQGPKVLRVVSIVQLSHIAASITMPVEVVEVMNWKLPGERSAGVGVLPAVPVGDFFGWSAGAGLEGVTGVEGGRDARELGHGVRDA